MVLDRRRFLTGAWPSGPRDAAHASGRRAASCGILVQAHPARLDQAVAAIRALDDVEVVAHDRNGKLTVSLADQAAVAPALTAITRLPGVLSAAALAAPATVRP